MSTLMKSPQRPKSMQVEVDEPYKEDIMSFMALHNYTLSATHYSRARLKRISEGHNPEAIMLNAIFRPG